MLNLDARVVMRFAACLSCLPAVACGGHGQAPAPAGGTSSLVSALATKAEHGDSDAMLALGEMHEFGLGVELDLERAAKYYRRATFGPHRRGTVYIPAVNGRPGTTILVDDPSVSLNKKGAVALARVLEKIRFEAKR